MIHLAELIVATMIVVPVVLIIAGNLIAIPVLICMKIGECCKREPKSAPVPAKPVTTGYVNCYGQPITPGKPHWSERRL